MDQDPMHEDFIKQIVRRDFSLGEIDNYDVLEVLQVDLRGVGDTNVLYKIKNIDMLSELNRNIKIDAVSLNILVAVFLYGDNNAIVRVLNILLMNQDLTTVDQIKTRLNDLKVPHTHAMFSAFKRTSWQIQKPKLRKVNGKNIPLFKGYVGLDGRYGLAELTGVLEVYFLFLNGLVRQNVKIEKEDKKTLNVIVDDMIAFLEKKGKIVLMVKDGKIVEVPDDPNDGLSNKSRGNQPMFKSVNMLKEEIPPYLINAITRKAQVHSQYGNLRY